MTVILAVGVIVVAVCIVVLFGAMVELFRQLEQMRQFIGMMDNAQPIDFKPDVEPADSPVPLPAHAAAGRSLLLFLSDGCVTCKHIAAALAEKQHFPKALLIIIESRSLEGATAFREAAGLPEGLAVYDAGDAIAWHFGVSAFPAALRLEHDRPVGAATVPSYRQLETVLNWLRADQQDTTFQGATNHAQV